MGISGRAEMIWILNKRTRLVSHQRKPLIQGIIIENHIKRYTEAQK